MRFYLTYRNHGLYDPVLDDAEVIYVPIDPDELGIVNIQTDLQQQKTELNESYQIDSATLVQPIDSLRIEPDVENLPFLVDLNEIPPGGKFKLPISEQYDPEGKRVKLCKINGKKVVRFDLKQITKDDIREQRKSEELQNVTSDFIKETKFNQERTIKDVSNLFQKEEVIDLNIIKEKALDIVTESINKAIINAYGAKQNIKNEQQSDLVISKIPSDRIKVFDEKSKELNFQKEAIKGQYDVNVSEEIKKFEFEKTSQSERIVEERKQLTKQDIDESISTGTVTKRFEVFNKENMNLNEPIKVYKKSTVMSKFNSKDEKFQDSEAKRRVFSIGLQTIPNIKEKVDTTQVDSRLKLLTTFFLQLTNIMVALSKIILTQPVTYISQKDYTKSTQKEDTKETTEINENIKDWEDYNYEGQGLSKYKYDYDSHISEGELIRKGKLTGAKIAQIEGGKPEELTDRMDLVISEFQKKTGREEHIRDEHEQFFRSQSESKSRMKGDDSFYSTSQKARDTDSRKLFEEFSETKTQSYEIKEMKTEKRTFESVSKTEPKPYVYETTTEGDNLTYVAIVEAHVYTNKDAIFQEKLKKDSLIKSEHLKTETLEKDTLIKDATKLSLAETVVIPETKEVSLKDIKHETIEMQTIKSGIEEASIKVAAKKISEVIEPLVKLAGDTFYSVKEAQTSIEPFKSLVQTDNVTTEEFEQYFVAKTVLSQKIYPSLEQPTKSVVEITEIVTDENENQDVHVLDVIEEKSKVEMEKARSIAEITEISLKEDEIVVTEDATPNFVKLREGVESVIKTVAETTEVTTGVNIEIFNTLKQADEKPLVAIESGYKTTAETITMIPEENKSDLVEEIKMKMKITPSFDMEEKRAVETLTVYPEEPKSENFESIKMEEQHPKANIELSNLTVPEIFAVFPGGPKDEPLEIPKVTECKSYIDIMGIKAAETIVIQPQEPNCEKFADFKVEEKQGVTLTEGPHLTVAQVISMLPEESKGDINVPELKKHQAEVKILELKVAETLVVESEESKQPEIKSEQLAELHPKVNIESISLYVPEILATTVVESSKTLEVPLISEKDPKILTEDIRLAVAETLVVESEESKQPEIKSEQLAGLHPKVNIESISLHVPEILSTTVVESSKTLEVPLISGKDPKILTEAIRLAVAETTAIVPCGPKDETLQVAKVEECKLSFDVVDIKAAETILVRSEEPKFLNLESVKVDEKQSVTSIEGPHLTVAQIEAMTLAEAKAELKVPELLTHKANIKILDLKAADSIVVQAVESKQPELIIEKVNEHKSITNVEPSNLGVVEILTRNISESSKEISNLEKNKSQQALVEIAEHKAIETTEVALGDLTYTNITIPDRETKKIKTAIAESVQSVAQKTEVHITEAGIPIPKAPKVAKKEARVKFSFIEPIEQESITTLEVIEGDIKEKSKIVSNEARLKLVESTAATIEQTTAVSEATKHTFNLYGKDVKAKSDIKIEEKQSKTAIERPSLAVAETVTILPQESRNEFEVKVMKNQKAKIGVSELKTAEVNLTSSEEVKESQLKLDSYEEKKLKQSIELSNLSVAQVSATTITEASKNIFEEKKIKNQQARFSFEEHKAVETEQTFKDLSCKTLTLVAPEERKTQTKMEESVQSVAQVTEVHINEAENKIFEIKDKAKEASLILNAITPIEEVSIMTLEVVENDIQKSKQISNKATMAMVESTAAAVQQVVAVAEAKKEDFKFKALKDVQANLAIEESMRSEAQIKAVHSTEHIKDIELVRKIKTQQRRKSSTSPTSPTTPLIEEYMFSVEAELEHPYIIGPGVSEEALLRIKAERTQIASADTSFTLTIESTVEGDSENIEEIEEMEDIYFSKKSLEIQNGALDTTERLRTKASTQVDFVSLADSSAETVNLDVNQKILKQKQTAMQDTAISNKGSHKRVRFGALSTSAETNRSSMEISQDSATEALDDATYKLSLKKAVVEGESMISYSGHKSLQSSKFVTGMSSEMNMSAMEIGQDLSAATLSSEASYQLSLQKAMTEDKSMVSQSGHKTLQSGEFVTGMSSEMDMSPVSHELSAEADSYGASYKVSLQHSAMMDAESMSSQDSKSQASSRRTRKVKSSKSKRSASEQGSSLQIMEAGSLETRMEGGLEYGSALQIEQTGFTSKSMESSAGRSLTSETFQHDMNSGSKLQITAGSKSLDSRMELGVMQYSAEVKDVLNTASLKEKLTLRTDVEGAITNGSVTSPPLVPPTPLTDEYIFRLETNMPEESPFVQRDCSLSPDSMHAEMLVNGFIPHYQTIVGRRIVYSPPLPTPPTSPEKTKPSYSKPGLKGGSDKMELTEEQLLECQRNTRLVRAIDRTLKQIEEYKASVGITDEMSKEEIKEYTTLSEEQTEENVDKEFKPIYTVEEWKDDEDFEVKEKGDISDSIKITILTEDTSEGETVTVITEKDEEGIEIEEVLSNLEDTPVERIENTVNKENTVQIDSNKSQDIHNEELMVMEPCPSNEVICDDGVVATVSDSDLSDKEYREQTTNDLKDLTILPDRQNIGVTSRSSGINKILSKTRFLQF